MKVELTLPDWCDERDIVILAGIELAAYKHPSESVFKVKETRCNYCGECCLGQKPESLPFIDKEGNCIHLTQDGEKKICGIGVYRSYACCACDPIIGKEENTKCCITYIEG